MAVPDTHTFGLKDVAMEIYGSKSGKSLRQCFIDATGTFDPTYAGNKDRLSNFRKYSSRAKAWRGIAPYCIQGGRPSGLTTINIKYGYYAYYRGQPEIPIGTFIVTTGRDYSGDYTYNGAFDCSFWGWHYQDGEHTLGFDAQSENFAVGDTVYLGTGDDLEVVPDGWYVVYKAYIAPDYNAWDTAHHIEGGVITEITYSPW